MTLATMLTPPPPLPPLPTLHADTHSPTLVQGEIQEGLYNLLGDTGFDFMELLMANIAKLRRLNVKSVRTAAAIPTEQLYAAAAGGGGGTALPSVTTTVRVMSESDKRLAKLMRKVGTQLHLHHRAPSPHCRRPCRRTVAHRGCAWWCVPRAGV